MTRKKTALIIVCSVLILSLFGGAILLFSENRPGVFRFSSTGYYYNTPITGDIKSYLTGGGEVDSNTISTVEIDWGAGETKIEKSSDNHIRFQENAKFSMSDNQKMRYKVEGSTLRIIYCTPGRNVFSNRLEGFGKELTVYLPEKVFDFSYDASSADMKLTPNLAFGRFEYDVSSASLSAPGLTADTLNYNASSGDCEISGEIKKMELDSSSGKITLNNIKGDTLECDTSSGDCKVSGTFRSVSLSTSSGRVDSDGLSADSFTCGTTSGDWNIKGNFKTIEGDTSSGAVNLALASCPASANISTTSGNIIMAFPDNRGFTAHYDTSSGNFSSSFSGTTANSTFTYGDGNSKLNFSTSSGNINIQKN